MGSSFSKPKPTSAESTPFTVAPKTTSAPCQEWNTSRGTEPHSKHEHLLFAFFAGVLLTLLLGALVLLIIRSYRKCKSPKGHSSVRALDSHPDPHLAKLSPPEDTVTYASMTFPVQEGRHAPLAVNHSVDSGASVYAQVKVTDSSHLAKET